MRAEKHKKAPFTANYPRQGELDEVWCGFGPVEVPPVTAVRVCHTKHKKRPFFRFCRRKQGRFFTRVIAARCRAGAVAT